ncbi:MAG: hypothetical protein IJS39_13775 [Synergistaceae bacterium]|nr:hypothetical protein [Synergistaceae bacterium]
MKNIYRIAGRNILIESLYPDVHAYCRDYLSENADPDFSVSISQQDIDFERSKAIHDFPYSDAYLEELAVYRKIAELMPSYSTVLIHGSALAADGAAYMFTAVSGTGKSTHARLWRELLGSRVTMINDDKPLVRISGTGKTSRAEVFGTPYNGKHRLGKNTSVPLKAICILERSEHNRIAGISPQEAYPFMIQQTYRPRDTAMLTKTLELVDGLMSAVKFYRLGCNMDIQAAELAYNTMKG